jgi:hypothetical protein
MNDVIEQEREKFERFCEGQDWSEKSESGYDGIVIRIEPVGGGMLQPIVDDGCAVSYGQPVSADALKEAVWCLIEKKCRAVEASVAPARVEMYPT